MDREMIEKVLTELEQPMIDTLRTLVRIPSVKDAPQPGAPFGKPAREALDKALEICAGLGFDCANIDGYAGHADLGEGTTQDALAVLGHLDVVPVGDNWTCEPFGAEIRDGKMYGRGTSDDKGPVVAAMYAMAAIKRLGLPLRRKIRLILGTDEESGWEDMRYYRKACGMPRSGFSPDADYPVINIEKGSIHLEIEGKLSDQGLPVIRFDTGDRPNVVPGRAEALIAGDQALADMINATDYGWPVTAEATDEGVILRTEGIPGHAAMPEGTCNAIGLLLKTLKALGVNAKRVRIVSGLLVTVVAAVTISFVGVIGFVGIVAPHVARLLIGSEHRVLLPASTLIGALLVLIADTIGRTIISPTIIPVGIVLSVVGAPIFLYLILSQNRRRMV